MARQRTSTLWRTQNFLRDPRLIDHLAARAGITSRDVVYDLGAGEGSLTAALASRAGRVVAIERDARLVEHLRRRFARQSNVVVRRADITRYPFPRSDYVVFASPPFDITAAVLETLVTARTSPRTAYLVLQREAAQRFIGRPRMTLAALLIAPWFELGVLHHFRRTDFVPAPSVETVFVRMNKRGPPLIDPTEAPLFRDLVVALFTPRVASVAVGANRVFGQRAGVRLIDAAGIRYDAPPSSIDLVKWMRLYRSFAALPEDLQARVAGSEARLRRQQRRLQKTHRTRVPRDALHAA